MSNARVVLANGQLVLSDNGNLVSEVLDIGEEVYNHGIDGFNGSETVESNTSVVQIIIIVSSDPMVVSLWNVTLISCPYSIITVIGFYPVPITKDDKMFIGYS